jgi:hypothetical protein
MITSGFENEKFYLEFISSSRPYGNMREESDRRALELAGHDVKYMLGLSGGLDSQTALHSFCTQGIPIETVFLYMPNYNDNEYEQVKFIDKKYGITTQVIDFDPYLYKNEIESVGKTLDVPILLNVIHGKFLSLLPEEIVLIEHNLDPFVYVSPSLKYYYHQGYYMPEMCRERSFNFYKGSRNHIMFSNTPEFILSTIADDISVAALRASEYFDGNYNKTTQFERWDVYIKPLLYGKYWGNELTYFPKFAGRENIDFLNYSGDYLKYMKTHAVAIPYYEFLNFMKNQSSSTQRFYENITSE